MIKSYAESNHGIINSVFPIELVGKVWDYLTLTDLLRYSKTSKCNYNDVHNAIRDSVHQVLGQFCLDPARFLAELRKEHAIVSGSVALYAMLGVTFGGGNDNEQDWKLNDIDVYVPILDICKAGAPFVTYMAYMEGYHHVGRRVRAEEGYILFPEVKDIISLQKGTIRMDVILSGSRSSLKPILRYHSTPVMNGISGNGMFSAYPEMTCAYHGNFNPMVFVLDRSSPKLPPVNVRRAFHKYTARSFDIRRNPSCWSDSDVVHVCTKSSHCPLTTRNVEDWGCLYITFRELEENDGVGLKKGSISEDFDRSCWTKLTQFGLRLQIFSNSPISCKILDDLT